MFVAQMQKCHLHSTSLAGGAFTAHKRSAESEDTGFSFVGCKLTGVGKSTSILGRPWGRYSRVVFALSYMSSTVRPEGWDGWSDDPAKQRCARAYAGAETTCPYPYPSMHIVILFCIYMLADCLV